MSTSFPQIPKSTHITYLQQTLDLARKSPPKPTNFRVGCVIVSFSNDSTQSPEQSLQGTILSTGYTLELPGNTHAEQCALKHLSLTHLSSSPSSDPEIPHLPAEYNTILYTSLEPCSVRLSGNTPCVQRIIQTRDAGAGSNGGIRKVIFGAKEPGTFVQDSQSCRILTDAGVEWEYIPDLEEEILSVAMEGHQSKKQEKPAVKEASAGSGGSEHRSEKKETRIDDITDEERKRQEAQPRNPKKRMFEFNPQAGG